MTAGDVQTINLIIKADVQGSVETLAKTITDQNTVTNQNTITNQHPITDQHAVADEHTVAYQHAHGQEGQTAAKLRAVTRVSRVANQDAFGEHG